MKLICYLLKFEYFLILQIFLLIISAYYDFLPFYFFVVIISLLYLAYKTYKDPIFIIVVLIFLLIIDALIPYKASSTTQSIMLSEAIFILFSPIVFLRFIFDLKWTKKVYYELLIWLPFLIWALVIGLLVSIDKIKVLSYWKNYLVGFFAFITTYIYMIESKNAKKILISLIFWAILLVFIELKVLLESGSLTTGLIGLYFYKNLLDIGWGRSNYIATFFVVIIPITIGYLVFVKKIIWKVLLLISLIIMFIGVTLTLSRGGILALLLAIILLMIKLLNRKYVVSFLVVLSIIAIVILVNPLTYVIIERISTLETSHSVYSRINFYKDVWNAYIDNPLTGVGLGNLGYYSKFILGPDESPSAHNIILGALGELGLVGALFYLSIFVYLGIKIFNAYKKEDNILLKSLRWSFFASFIGGILHSLMEPNLEGFQFSIIFWVIVALNFHLNLLSDNEF